MAQGGLSYADAYEMEIHDPVLNRTISHQYSVEVMKEKVL